MLEIVDINGTWDLDHVNTTLITMWCSSFSLESSGEYANNTLSLAHFWLATFKGVNEHIRRLSIERV